MNRKYLLEGGLVVGEINKTAQWTADTCPNSDRFHFQAKTPIHLNSPGRLKLQCCDLCKHHLTKTHKKIKQRYKTASCPQDQTELVQLSLPHFSLAIKELTLQIRDFTWESKSWSCCGAVGELSPLRDVLGSLLPVTAAYMTQK